MPGVRRAMWRRPAGVARARKLCRRPGLLYPLISIVYGCTWAQGGQVSRAYPLWVGACHSRRLRVSIRITTIRYPGSRRPMPWYHHIAAFLHHNLPQMRATRRTWPCSPPPSSTAAPFPSPNWPGPGCPDSPKTTISAKSATSASSPTPGPHPNPMRTDARHLRPASRPNGLTGPTWAAQRPFRLLASAGCLCSAGPRPTTNFAEPAGSFHRAPAAQSARQHSSAVAG